MAEVGLELGSPDSQESMLPLCHGTVDGNDTFVGKYICNIRIYRAKNAAFSQKNGKIPWQGAAGT